MKKTSILLFNVLIIILLINSFITSLANNLKGCQNHNHELLDSNQHGIKSRLSKPAVLEIKNKLGKNTNETEAIVFLAEYNKELGFLKTKSTLADWAYATNITDANANASTAAGLILTKFNAEQFELASKFDPTNFSNDTKRQLRAVGSKSLSDEEMKRLATIISKMGSIYGEGKVCRNVESRKECLPLEPDLTEILAESRNASERLWAWEGWRTEVGRKIRPLYLEYVGLKNKLARLNGFADYGDQLRRRYESDSFANDVQELYDEMKPLYVQLHTYIRRKLYQVYGPDVVNLTGTIPQHLTGGMWGFFWNTLYSIVVPYPDQPALDVTPALIAQNYTVHKMFQAGEEFYTSMGLKPLPSTFYNISMLEKPNDREVICHAQAWDFYDGKDFRIKMCANINFQDFLTIHHELGHIEYFMEYAAQPTVYKEGASDGFHEAIGDLMGMCVSTPKHLKTLNLLDTSNIDPRKTEINFLLSTALNTIPTLPNSYSYDLWRWRVFAGDYGNNPQKWNEEFWKLTEELVGVHAPVPRTAEDFDPASLFHVAQDVDLIRYFTKSILQFQFAEALCKEAGQTGPLHDCDFFGSKAAGTKLSDMLKLGSSKPWPDTLEKLTSERTMNARAIRKYFEPLRKWLIITNSRNGDTPGWITF